MSPETLKEGKWHWYNIMADLENAGIKDVIIDPLTVGQYSCAGSYRDKKILISWLKDLMLILSMEEYFQDLVDGFSGVLDYRPFCKYVSNLSGLPTVEWSKKDSEIQYEKLKNSEDVRDLEWLL